MAEICCGVVSESETGSAPCEPSSRAARRRRMEIRRFKFVTGAGPPPEEENEKQKRQKLDVSGTSSSLSTSSSSLTREWDNAVENGACSGEEKGEEKKQMKVENGRSLPCHHKCLSPPSPSPKAKTLPKYGVASVCGNRRDMEDAVAVHPSFYRKSYEKATDLHYFGVYDGHGCSHVATRCRERMHEVVREELEKDDVDEVTEWRGALERSFTRMDKEVSAWNKEVVNTSCRCELQTPECDAVGSTAVTAIVTADKIVIANCGDSRAVLCRNGKSLPLSSDHKPDRPDELQRIEEAGGRVIYWDGARVLGMLAMSRAIGDNYLKPYVICSPEVMVVDRTEEDECLILASDGLWDVVSNEIACGVARVCLHGNKGQVFPLPPEKVVVGGGGGGGGGGGRGRGCSGSVSGTDKACLDVSMLLTKLALARHSSDNVSVVVVDLTRDT
ncbi:hypothetical protein Ddye_024003 [Dipteronia dyeriana]|uniref:protein-serine/threonine phosphatase n=1 Tax=Dipteronia dyeriana TaxID=168575 RepID=A0AAD9WTY4_9ROSI|nr:hypothetical protein Ddye_024003 [Dipteronia dyeriana]